MAIHHGILVICRIALEPEYLLPLGQVEATHGALDLLDRVGTNASILLSRHQCGDWGDISTVDAEENLFALRPGNRLLSAYRLGVNNERLWIITEHDRGITTLLLPGEY
jgi:hypothetical protein